MKKLIFAFLALMTVLAMTGCGDTQTSATKEEEENYANPVKEPPPEAGGPPPAAGN